jgi:hypothetical protein
MAFDLAYDEGGEGNDLLVSMYVSRIDRAKKLKKSWRRKLRGIDYFHSKEFKNISHGVFKGMSLNNRRVMLGELSTLIHRHISLGVTSRINVEFYNSITTQNFRSRWGTAYTFSINLLALSAWIYFGQRSIATDVNILIEDGHRHSAQALEVMQDAKKLKGEPGQYLDILSAALGSKKDHPILQAADMLAYSEWKNIANGDREIWDALHSVQNANYQSHLIVLDEPMIKSIAESADNWIQMRKDYGKRTHKKDLFHHIATEAEVQP